MHTNDEVTIIISAKDQFTIEMKKIETEARDTKKKLDKELVYKLKADVAQLDLALKDTRAKLRKATSVKARWKLTLDTQDLQRELTEAKRRLNNYLNTGDQNLSRLQAKFNQVGNVIKDVFSGGGLNALDAFLGKLPKIGGKLQAILAVIVGIGKSLIQAGKNAQEFEDTFAGVRKTLDDSEENLQKIEKGLIGMSKTMPMTVKELGGIAELGGQLGVPTQNLLTFTDAIAKLSVSTNLTSEAAATDFARIANITQEPLSNIDRMGSAVVALGNNFATTESEIIKFATNIAGAGEIAGLTTDQVFAISAAFSSVGIEAEAGGTATQKVLLAINNAVNKGGKTLEAYARIAGKSAADFKTAWKDNAGQGFLSFVEGLQKSGQDANLILEEMGLKDTRLQKSFLSLANAGDLLNNALATGNKAWEENNALQEEADKRFQTTTSQIQIQNNKWQAFSAQFGMVWNAIRVPVFTRFTDFFTNILPTASNNIGIFFENTFQLIANFGKNIRKAINNLPAAFTSATNATLGTLEGFINSGISGLNTFINLIKKIPGASDLIGDFNISTISLGRVAGPEFDPISLTDGFKEFESFSQNRSKQYEIAAGKVKEGIKKEIQTELSMLEDIQNILDDKKGGSSKSKTEALKKALDQQRDLEIKAIQDSLLDEEEKMKKLTEIKEKYDKKKKDLEGKTNDELLKEAEDYMEKLKKGRENDYKDHHKKAEDALKDVQKYTKSLDGIKQKFQEIKDKATDTLRGIKHDMEQLDQDHIADLGARHYEVNKSIKENEYNNTGLKWITDNYTQDIIQGWKDQGQKEVNDIAIDTILEQFKLKQELLFLEQQTTEEQREQAKLEAEKSESVKKVEKYNKQKAEMLEKQQITQAFSSSDAVDGKKMLITEGEEVKYWDEQKQEYAKITDFKNQEYARDLINQQLKLETEYKTEQKHLEDSRQLVIDHSKAILDIRQQDTGLYKKELKIREDAVKAHVESVKAMMAEIARAQSIANSSTHNNQVINSNNKTTNYNITQIGSTRSSFPGVGLK